MTNLPAQILHSSLTEEFSAVTELTDNLQIADPAGIIFFCSSHYRLELLSEAINQSFDCPVTGCTTAGEITGEYHSNSIVALVFSSSLFAIHSVLLQDVKQLNKNSTIEQIKKIENELKFSSFFSADNMFSFLLSDGMSMKEEKIISTVYQALGGMQVFGGSAGDNMLFEQTYVFSEGRFYSDAAIISVIEIMADFSLFRLQHFTPSEKEVITTRVDYNNRLVYEINGEPAAVAYANINGLDSNTLTHKHFAMYPLMLKQNNEWYIRSISSVNTDKSLSFHCAIDCGLPLTIGSGHSMVESLKNQVVEIESEFEQIYFTLGCDCSLRRLEILENDLLKEIEDLLLRLNFIGFSTYGEQINGIHFNQTLVAIVVGKRS